ncbi:conjugative transfer signal peptidase TraF [Xenorhabdus bovienii]|uniref:conjugative transfer signal peptidase TraF n=1 Tax=Xenorhabdus bovienii TaxID=40576 RepID=UPI003DA24B06
MRLVQAVVFTVAGILLISAGIHTVGIRFNTSESIPVGFYSITSMPIAKGEYVLFCPPQQKVFEEAKTRGYINSGFCTGSYGYMMKKILAAKGDIVSVNQDGVTVNEEKIPFSKPLLMDASGHPLPRLTIDSHLLNANELLLMTDQSSSSFDARYFGFINQKQIKGVIRPMFTW